MDHQGYFNLVKEHFIPVDNFPSLTSENFPDVVETKRWYSTVIKGYEGYSANYYQFYEGVWYCIQITLKGYTNPPTSMTQLFLYNFGDSLLYNIPMITNYAPDDVAYESIAQLEPILEPKKPIFPIIIGGCSLAILIGYLAIKK